MRWLSIFFLAVGAVALVFFYQSLCLLPFIPWPSEGSQGYREWRGDTLVVFEERSVCIPDGWMAVGAESVENRTAEFAPGKTAVLIQSDAFLSETLAPPNSAYTISLLYPSDTSPEEVQGYRENVLHAFTTIGSLYNDKSIHSHTVLITTGLAGEKRVYPDPSLSLNTYLYEPEHPRGQELFTHAVAHLYNRHRTDLTAYANVQAPFSAEEFQELEATWAEIALARNPEYGLQRTLYLYGVHTALMNGRFDLITEPPFNTPDFAQVRPGIMVPPDGTFLEAQYGHYVLAPLVMVAIDGLLAPHGSSVSALLAEVHAQQANFLSRVKEIAEEDAAELDSWIQGTTLIPWSSVLAGLETYQ